MWNRVALIHVASCLLNKKVLMFYIYIYRERGIATYFVKVLPFAVKTDNSISFLYEPSMLVPEAFNENHIGWSASTLI